jgi:hypothetical protein
MKLRGGELYVNELKELRAFIKSSRTLNIEGYAAFRMAPLRERLDLMIFTLIKMSTDK